MLYKISANLNKTNFMKTRYKISPFYLNGLKQKPKDLDFGITPSLVFSQADPEEVGDLGWAFALGIKWGYWAVGIKLYGAYIFKH